MTRVLALAGQSKIGLSRSGGSPKPGPKPIRNGVPLWTETACRFPPKPPAGLNRNRLSETPKFAVGKTGVLGPVHLSLLRSRKRLLAQGIDGFRSALATPYSRAWTRPRLKTSRASPDGSLGRSSVRLSDGVTTSVERSPLRSPEFPVALLLQSRNRND